MKTNPILPAALVLSILVLGACAPAGTSTARMPETTATPGAMMQGTSTPEAMMSQGSETPGSMMGGTSTPAAMMSEGSPTSDAMKMQASSTPGSGMMMETVTPNAMQAAAGGMMADWLGTSLTDARSGGSFKLSDFSGKLVLVDLMAVNGSSCAAQGQQLQSLGQMLGQKSDVAIVSLDIDPQDSPAALTKFVQAGSFTWMAALAPAALSHAIGQTYGSQYLDPASTSILLIDRHGVVHPQPAGLESAPDLLKAVQQYLGM